MAGGEAVPQNAERMGVAAANLEFSSWGWAFRSQEVEDYGIDAHVEPFNGPSSPTGRLLALQIKSGESYFGEETDGGWWYRGKNRHLRYWLGHVLPVLIVLYDPVSRTMYWQHETEDLVVYSDDAWKILIPRHQVLAADAADQLRSLSEAAPGASEDPVASSLPFLPATAAAVLRSAQASAPDGTMRLARLLAQGRDQSRLTAETILAARPSWLAAGNGSFEAAIGAYANEHGHQDLALLAFERAAEYESGEAGRLYSVAALLALGQCDAARARDLLRRGSELMSGGLFLSVAHAALADHDSGDEAESPRVAGVLSEASREELAAEPTLVVLLGEFAARRGDLAEAIRLFEAASTGSPPLAVARLQLAQALIARAAAGGSAVAVSDRVRAQALSREIRDETRLWSGPSEKALAVLLKAQIMIGAFQETIRLATPQSLGGVALDREASFGEVAVYGAEAAMAMRDRVRAASFGQLVTGTRAETFIGALAIDSSAPAAEQATAWRAALASAEAMEQQRRALYQLAALGELQPDDLAAGQASQAIGKDQAQILSARNDAALGRINQAVISLRQHAESNSAAAEMLIEVLAEAGRTDDALAECERAISRFGAGKTAHDKLNILARAGRLDDADTFATSLLAGSDLAPEQRITLRQRLATNRANRGDWRGAEKICREALAENPDDPEFAWGLVTAQANQGHLDQAWTTYRQLTPPLTAPEFIPLWMRLHARAGFDEADIMTALDLVDRWANDPRAGATIFTAFLDLGSQELPDGTPVLPELSPDALARFRAERGAYALRYPDGPIAMIDLTDVDVTTVIRAQLLPHASQLNGTADLVRAGKLPLGALAAAASRPYAAMLLEQSTGAQYAVNPDNDALKDEIEVAKQALGGDVVIETSALALVTLLPRRWPALRSAFSTVRLPRPALADIEAARGELARAPGFSFSVSYNRATHSLVRSETSLADHQRLHQRIVAVEEAARLVELAESPEPPGPPDHHQAWSTAISLARAQGTALWSDDVALRRIAAEQGIPAFGTYALLAALTETGIISDPNQRVVRRHAD